MLLGFEIGQRWPEAVMHGCGSYFVHVPYYLFEVLPEDNMNYKETLNLPRTDFRMKANLAAREPEVLEKWEKQGLYDQIRKKSKGSPLFVLHDGPPYANGNIHLGTALNKILKDTIVRSRQLSGFDAPYVPGWDCHGLPIEHNVDKELGDKKKSMTIGQIRRLCRAYAERFVGIQKEEFKRLGVMGEWDRPYLTMDYSYVSAIVREFGKFAANGSLIKSKKPIYWCSACKTALAEAEVEYADHTSPSIYVRFPVRSDIGDAIPSVRGKKVSVVVWTTTPWTIPANLAVALHPDFEYVAADVGNDEVYILARDLLDACMKKFGIETYTVCGDIDARSLENKLCRHPLYNRDSKIILADHVTLDTGTGCVHIAPGHGREDYEDGLKYDLDIYSPVDDEGRFTDEVEYFAGNFVFDANSDVNAQLSEAGALLASQTIVHSYPHCWRCKKPVIFRSTKQWFISMDKRDLRAGSLNAINEVKWIPNWGRERIHGMVENRPDWCISRQRSWGVPIIAVYCADCKKPLITDEIIEHVAGLFESKGADIWFEAENDILLPKGTVCPHCQGTGFVRETDILDVWFDSGVSHAAVLEQRDGLKWPADLYLEGSDQHRGWFHSSLLTAVATRKTAPYKSVLTHGFVVDGQGKKMSKSVGNIVSPKEIIDKYGAEILRLWVASSDYQDDIRVSHEILKQLSDAYRRIRNTSRFLLGNISDFDPSSDRVSYEEMMEIDQWALHRLQELTTRIKTAYDDFEFHVIYHALHNFCVLDMSAFYLDILKDRLYTSPERSHARRSAQTAMFDILDAMVRLMAPIMIFTADEIWNHLPGIREASVHLTSFPEVNRDYVNEELAEEWETIRAVRREVTKALEDARNKKKIGHSLDAAVTVSLPSDLFDVLLRHEEQLRAIFIVSAVTILRDESLEDAYQSDKIENLRAKVVPASAKKCERCWVHDPTVGDDAAFEGICARCVKALQEGKGA
jgi:isoleucyl-tRNA synthetase